VHIGEDTDFFTSRESLPVSVSAVTVVGVGVVGFSILVLVAILAMRQATMRAREARAAEDRSRKGGLRPGFRVVHGRVETDDGEPAVRVLIRQWSRIEGFGERQQTVWREVGRDVVVRPFRIALADGQIVKVEPGAEVQLVSDLAPEKQLATDARTRVAELKAGSSAFACGRVVGAAAVHAYRGDEHAHRLLPWDAEPMLISTEPLEERYVRRARLHRYWALGLAATLLAINVGLFGSYWVQLLFGHVVIAPTVATQRWSSRSRPDGVRAVAKVDGRDLTLSAKTSSDYAHGVDELIKQGKPVTTPFVVATFPVLTFSVGTRPTLDLRPFFWAWIGFAFFAFSYGTHTRRSRPWYERKVVVEAA